MVTSNQAIPFRVNPENARLSTNSPALPVAAPPPRKPSPPRQNTAEEQTFKQKLEEIKRMRSSGAEKVENKHVIERTLTKEEPIVPKQVHTLTGLKTFLKSFGDWIEPDEVGL